MRLFILLGLIGLSFLFNNNAVCAFTCTKAFQNAEHKQERTILVYLKCKIQNVDTFVSLDLYAEHLEYLYAFVLRTRKTNVTKFSIETINKLDKFLEKIKNLHLCARGFKEDCTKKKRSFKELEALMEKACQHGSSLCNFYGEKLLKRIETWDYPPFTE